MERINTLLFNKPFRSDIEEGFVVNNFRSFDLFIKGLHTHSFIDVDCIKYANDMVEFISAHTNLYDVVDHYDYYEEKSFRFITLSEDCLSELFDLLVYSDNTFPMISAPNNWAVNVEKDGNYHVLSKGGYYEDSLDDDCNFIHNKYKNQGDVKLDSPNIINTINYLQGVEYMINKDVLEIIIDRLASGCLKNLLHIDFHPLTNNMSKLKKESNIILIKEILRYNSICFVNRQILSQAIILKNSPDIYFPIFID